eukprot:g19035.t1
MSRPQGQINFQKPENALRRAKELASVGNEEDALALCANVMGHRKFKNSNTLHVMEQIAILALSQLSVGLKDLKSARDVLINYRSMTQTTATSSLEKVVREFRTAAENLVKQSRDQASQCLDAENAPEDLELLDTPDNALRKALKPKETRDQEKKEREVLENVRFLWETYKQVLDVFKTNGKTEDLYNETAQRALQFCLDQKRTNEFKKLCDLLRNNYQNLFKRAAANGTYPSHAVNPTDKDTIQRTIETRCYQLKVAGDLGLWKECFLTAEDLYSLMTKKKPRPAVLAQYYDFLSQICWKSGSFLFHAFACVRNYTLYKINHKSLTAEEKQRMASLAVLATMCVPLEEGSQSSLSSTSSLSSASASIHGGEAEKLRRMAQLFNVATVPTKATLKTDLQVREILLEAHPAVQKLYQLVEMAPTGPGGGQLYSKDICAKCKPMLEELRGNADTATYCDQLQKVIFFRLLGQLSKVYSTMTVEQLKKLCEAIVDFPTAEKWMISSARDSGVHVQLDYVRSVVVFANKASNDLSTLRQPLVTMSTTTLSQLSKVYPGLEIERKREERSELFSALKEKREDEARDIERRVNEIERRNKEKAEFEKEALERKERQAVRQKAEDAKSAAKRLEEEKKRRAEEAAKSRRNDLDRRRMMEVIDELRKIYYDQNIKIGEFPLNDIQDADLEKLDLEFVESERTRIIKKDRGDKVRMRKQEAKRVDHLARAVRIEGSKKIGEIGRKLRMEQEKEFAEIEEEKKEAAKQEWAENAEKKKHALEALAGIKQWQEEHIGKKEVEYQERMRVKKKAEWEKKCMRAVRRLIDHQEAEERRQIEEERRREEEEEEARVEAELAAKEAKDQEERELRMAERRKAEEERAAERERNAPKQVSNGNWRDEQDGPRAAASGKGGKANGGGHGFDGKDGGKFGVGKFDRERDGGKTSFGRGKDSQKGGGPTQKGNGFGRSNDSYEERDFGDLRSRAAPSRDLEASKGLENKGNSDRFGGEGDMDWRGGGGRSGGKGGKDKEGGLSSLRGGDKGGFSSSKDQGGEGDGGPPASRPIPAWKKYAMEKKQQQEGA